MTPSHCVINLEVFNVDFMSKTEYLIWQYDTPLHLHSLY